MNEYWINFTSEFCKVDFLCHNGEPHWLGWFALVVAVVIALSFLSGVWSMFKLGP